MYVVLFTLNIQIVLNWTVSYFGSNLKMGDSFYLEMNNHIFKMD